MSRYKPYGKTKSHGAGFQFDKLLKVCSNSKKASASATKTVGNLGRFGSTNFTSTRNSNLDSSGEDELSSLALYKRPRFDVGKPIISSTPYASASSYDYPAVQNQNIPGTFMPQEFIHTSTNNANCASAPEVYKPKKFFKSRNPLGVVDPTPLPLIVPETSRPTPLEKRNYIPPITIPIPKLSSDRLTSTNKATKKRQPKASGETRSRASKRQVQSNNSQNVNNSAKNVTPPAAQPPTNLAYNNSTSSSGTSLTSPSIKLRIFKDKTTSTFVSVSDALPPKLQVEKSPKKGKVITEKEKKKPGRPPRKQKQEPTPPVVQAERKNPVRITRNRKQRNSDSSVDTPMPTLRRVSVNSSKNGIEDLSMIEHTKDSSIELVKKLEDEDDEFREMSAMLSSMDGGDDESIRIAGTSSAINQHLAGSNAYFGSFEPQNLSGVVSPKSKDIRAILEDDWDDEEDSPKKGSQTPKQCNVTRFDMAALMPDHTSAPQPLRVKSPRRKCPSPAQVAIPPPQPQSVPIGLFNAPYAVRNLLADFADVKNDKEMDSAALPTVADAPLEEIAVNTKIKPKRGGTNAVHHQVKQSTTVLTKKVSIFKSRAAEAVAQGEITSPKKRLALYKHKFGQESAEKLENVDKKPDAIFQEFVASDEHDEFDQRGIRIKNVKATHELQESGEVLEFDGDILYILDDLKDKNPISSRCLSAITLAMRCMEPSFRMHLRAHGTVGEFCRELQDAPTNPVLALLAATVLFVLSQDRLNMDLDTDSLQLLLALTKIEEQTHLIDESPEISKHRQKVIDLVSQMKQRGHAKDLKIERISASEIALETLLHLTSKRAGEWIKNELRTLGGLDYIVSEVDKLFNIIEGDFMASDWSENVKERLSKVDRCLRVLQQVSFNHEENQRFLLGALEFSEGNDPNAAIRLNYTPVVFVKLFRFFTTQLDRLPRDSEIAQVLREILFSVLRVLVNLTHDYRGIILGSEILSAQEGLVDLTLFSVFNLSFNFSDEKVFDLLMHSLCMLLNLVEISRANRNKILSSTIFCGDEANGTNTARSALDALVQLFFAKEREAKKEEHHTDDILTNSTDGKDTKDSQGSADSQKNSQEKDSEGSSLQDVIDKLIQTAGKHMENSLIAAYISLLIAYIVMDDPVSMEHVRNSMPDSKFLPLMVFLKKLFNFMSITSSASGSIRGLKATSVALRFFAQQDPKSNEELKKIIPD